MHLPDKIYIGDLEYDVKYYGEIHDKKDDCIGRCLHDQGLIQVKPFPKTYKNIIMHECIHGVSYYMNANLSEKQVDQIANGVRKFFIDNPNLIELLEL